MSHIISIRKHGLSDRSEVYSVHIGSVEINATTEKDAYELADKIEKAINEHSIDEAKAVSFA